MLSVAARAFADLLGAGHEVRDVTVDERRTEILHGSHPGPVAVGYDGTSTVCRLAAAAPRQVLLVPVRRGIRLSSSVERILIPLDGSAESARAVAGLAARCAATGVDIVVVHVFGPRTAPAFWDQPAHAVSSWGSEFLARYCNETMARIELRSGVAGAQIATAAADEQVDLIALCWSRDATAGHGRTLRRVLEAAAAPTLLLPVGGPVDSAVTSAPPTATAAAGSPR